MVSKQVLQADISDATSTSNVSQNRCKEKLPCELIYFKLDYRYFNKCMPDR